jgi:hypothetical protein
MSLSWLHQQRLTMKHHGCSQQAGTQTQTSWRRCINHINSIKQSQVSPRPNQQSREHPSRSGLLNQVGLQGYNVKTNDLSRCGLRVKFTWSLSQVTSQASSPRLHCRTTLTTPCTTTIISRRGAGRNIIMITSHKSRWRFRFSLGATMRNSFWLLTWV